MSASLLKRNPDHQYEELKTELAICRVGGLFLALYQENSVPETLIARLHQDLPGYFQFSLHMTDQKLWFPIFFSHTFEQIGERSNIFHVLGIGALDRGSIESLIRQLQYGRELFKRQPYSLVFWVHPEIAKQVFFEAPDFHHWLFGSYDFTDMSMLSETEVIKKHCKVQESMMTSIYKYLDKVVWQYEHWSEVKKQEEEFLVDIMGRANLHEHYVQSYCTNNSGRTRLLDDFLDEFLDDDQRNFLTLLGDFGTGKSSFALHYFVRQARKYLRNSSQRIPIFISLKDYPGLLDLKEFIVKEFFERYGISISFPAFQEMALSGRFVFFVDGFDEMASLADAKETIKNFRELTKLSFENIQFMTGTPDTSHKANKVFLTCRTHYFLTEAQERDILKADYTVLYRDYATKQNYEVARINLKEFVQEQVEEFVRGMVDTADRAEQILRVISDTYNLKELSSRPLLLEMIVKTVPTLKDQEQINAADLYKAYTDMWIERDDWRSQMTPRGKRELMWELAAVMNAQGGDFSLHYSRLSRPKAQYFKGALQDKAEDYYRYEATTCSFLNRDSRGKYRFIHKSFMEYFLAENFSYALLLKQPRPFNYKALNKEVQFFINLMIGRNRKVLEGVGLDYLDLSGINLSYGNFRSGSLEGSDLTDTDLSNACFVDANLKEAKIVNAILKHADLSNACLVGADLSKAKVAGAELTHADFSDAKLISADFSSTDLSFAKLQNTNCTATNFHNATLLNVDFEHALIGAARFQNANLTGVKNFADSYSPSIRAQLRGEALNDGADSR